MIDLKSKAYTFGVVFVVIVDIVFSMDYMRENDPHVNSERRGKTDKRKFAVWRRPKSALARRLGCFSCAICVIDCVLHLSCRLWYCRFLDLKMAFIFSARLTGNWVVVLCCDSLAQYLRFSPSACKSEYLKFVILKTRTQKSVWSCANRR